MENEDRAGVGLDAVLLAEPVIHEESTYHIAEGYRITKPNPPSPLVTNPHLATAILYKTVGQDVSFTEELELDSRVSGRERIEEHLGVTAVEMMVADEPFPSVLIISGYLPNRSRKNTLEYVQSVANTIIALVDRAAEGGCPSIIGMDTNCPFKEKGVYPASPNSPILRKYWKRPESEGENHYRW